MAVLGDFAEPVRPILQIDPGGLVYDRFRAEPAIHAIPVVDEQGRPVGLIERNAFFLQLGSEFGRALFARRPASSVMDCAPLVIEADRPADAFFSDALHGDGDELIRGLIVTRDGAYHGVVTPVGVLKASLALNRRRADEMERLAQDLAWAESEAQTSLRAKSQFLAVMSHEIRTPLNGVLAVAEIIDRKLADDALRPYVRTIINSGESLLRLLTDALDLSRAEAGALTLEEEPRELAAILRDLDGLWRPRAESEGLDFEVALTGATEAWILIDEVRLKQTFNNLIGNALKFTETGGVRVEVSSEVRDLHAELHCTVTDTGPGMGAEELGRVFQPFVTGERRKGAGAGLGLTICRQIVEAMGGSLEAESEPGEGSTFRFTLAAHSVPAQAPADCEPQPAELSGPLHVLVADDNKTNRVVAAAVLDMFGCTHAFAEDGLQAVEAARDGRFDVILMDVKMPHMDGVDATRAIRAAAGPERVTPIIALTANADPVDAESYLAAGMDAVVQKPLKPAALHGALARVLATKAALAA